MPGNSTIVDKEEQREGRWTRDEHDLFIVAFEKHGKDWRSISKMIKTRTNIQCRTHAQKYFGAELANYVHAPKPKPSSKLLQLQQAKQQQHMLQQQQQPVYQPFPLPPMPYYAMPPPQMSGGFQYQPLMQFAPMYLPQQQQAPTAQPDCAAATPTAAPPAFDASRYSIPRLEDVVAHILSSQNM